MLRRLLMPNGPSSRTEEVEDGDNSEEVVVETASNDGTFKSLLLRNQTFVSILQTFSGSCFLLIPPSYRYYECAIEGGYMLSGVIGFVNRVVIQNALECCTCLEDYMVLTTRAINQIEIFMEKIAHIIGGTVGRSRVIMYVEVVKALCRLAILIDRKAPTLLIYWQRDEDANSPKFNLCHYIKYYEETYTRIQNEQMAALTPARATVGDTPLASANIVSNEETENERKKWDLGLPTDATDNTPNGDEYTLTQPIVGKRSGLKIGPLRIPAHALPTFPSTNQKDVHNNSSVNTKSQFNTDVSLSRSVLEGQNTNTEGGTNSAEDLAFRYLPYGMSPQKQYTDVKDGVSPGNTSKDGTTSHESSPSSAISYHERDLRWKDEEGDKDELEISTLSSSGITPQVQQQDTSCVPGAAIKMVQPPKITAEQAIYFGEVLYVLRPAIYAWTLNFVAETRKTYADNIDSGLLFSNSSNEFNDTNTQHSANVAAMRYKLSNLGSWGESLSYLTERSLSLPQDIHSAISNIEDLDMIISLLVSLLVELLSIHWTSTGLKIAREQEFFRRESTRTVAGGVNTGVNVAIDSPGRSNNVQGSSDTPNVLPGSENRGSSTSLSTAGSNSNANSDILENESENGSTTASSASDNIHAVPEEAYNQFVKDIEGYRHEFDYELRRRRSALFYYFMRSPLFDRATMPFLRIASGLLGKIPLLNMLPTYAINYMSYFNNTHFRTSASS